MTTVIKQNTQNGYYVSLSLINSYNNDMYVVQVCPWINESMCGYPEKEMTYSIEDKKKAYDTYNRYIKKYCN